MVKGGGQEARCRDVGVRRGLEQGSRKREGGPSTRQAPTACLLAAWLRSELGEG